MRGPTLYVVVTSEYNGQVATSLHYFLSKASRSIDSLFQGLPMKSFDCLIPGVAARCLELLFFSNFLTLNLPTSGEIETAGSGPKNLP
jgi:hypothetical protein